MSLIRSGAPPMNTSYERIMPPIGYISSRGTKKTHHTTISLALILKLNGTRRQWRLNRLGISAGKQTLTMAIKVVSDLVTFAPVRNPPAVEPFIWKIDASPPLPPLLPPPYPPHVPPPMPPKIPPEPLPLIASPPHPSDSVSDKEDYVVVKFHQNKLKEYVYGPVASNHGNRYITLRAL